MSEVNPLDSLGKATAPIDSIFRAIGERIGGLDGIKSFLGSGSGRAKSNLLNSFKPEDTSGAGGVIGILKSGFILVANILLAVLQVVTSIIKFILGLVA